jgi:hypothetical protein
MNEKLLNREIAFKDLMDRKQAMNTAIPSDIAVPCARINAVNKYRYLCLDTMKILYIERDKHRISIHTEARIYFMVRIIKNITEKLDGSYFFQCNSSYIGKMNILPSSGNYTGYNAWHNRLKRIKLVTSSKKSAFLVHYKFR